MKLWNWHKPRKKPYKLRGVRFRDQQNAEWSDYLAAPKPDFTQFTNKS